MIVAGIPTVITLGTPLNPGDIGANIVEAAFYIGGLAAFVPLLERISHRTLSQLGVRPLDKFSWGIVGVSLVALLAMQVIYQAILGAFHQENHVQAGFEHFRVNIARQRGHGARHRCDHCADRRRVILPRPDLQRARDADADARRGVN